jgi:hypothetical protein
VRSPALDHLVYAVPELTSGIEDLYRLLGVRAERGGRHVGFGTHNALLGLGGGAYLELIAPDPSQPIPPVSQFIGFDAASLPRLAGWAARTDDIEAAVAKAREAGFDPGPILEMSRLRPDGVTLAWRLTWPLGEGGGLIPFLIDWGDSPHPSATAPEGVILRSLVVEYPEPQVLAAVLGALEVDVSIVAGARPALVATLDACGTTVVLR